jgi:hypothetical protein
MSDPELDALYGPLEAAFDCADRILAEQALPRRKPSKRFHHANGEALNNGYINTAFPCKFFLAGKCNYPDSCKFSHDPKHLSVWKRDSPEVKQADAADLQPSMRSGSSAHPRVKVKIIQCKFFLKGRCLKGQDCAYTHDVSRLGLSAYVNRAVTLVPLPALGKRKAMPDADADAREVRGRY